MNCVQTLAGADIDCDHNLLLPKICIRWTKLIRFRKGKPRRHLETLYAQRENVQDALEDKLGAVECESAVEQCEVK
jgi:hypothetical protein